MPRFIHNSKFDREFDLIDGLIWYPFVGVNFEAGPKRVMVFAHNAPVKPANAAEKCAINERKDFYARAVDENAYFPAKWTKTFRAFINGAVGLKAKFTAASDPEITARIDAFIQRIAFIQFIQGMVISDRAIALAEATQVEQSKEIAARLLKILRVTHCICWGNPVFTYLSAMSGFAMTEIKHSPRKGFGSGVLIGPSGQKIDVLKVHHPSMPNFKRFSEDTHAIIANFLA